MLEGSPCWSVSVNMPVRISHSASSVVCVVGPGCHARMPNARSPIRIGTRAHRSRRRVRGCVVVTSWTI